MVVAKHGVWRCGQSRDVGGGVEKRGGGWRCRDLVVHPWGRFVHSDICGSHFLGTKQPSHSKTAFA